jgi:hypothetical protein
MLLEGGTPVHIVSKMLGHSHASMTLDIYAHAVDTGGEVAGARLTALLASHAGNGRLFGFQRSAPFAKVSTRCKMDRNVAHRIGELG